MDDSVFSILDQFVNLKVLVIGEGVLDSSVRGKAGRLCIEAPVPVVDVEEGTETVVGAANAAIGAARLGARVTFLSTIGNDPEGDRLMELLEQEGIDASLVIRSEIRSTLLRRRIYAGDQLIVRYDQGSSEPIDGETESQLMEVVSKLCSQVSGLNPCLKRWPEQKNPDPQRT